MSAKKCFIFISTLEHIPWGGCEELWYKTALIALKNKHKVYVIVYRHKEIPNHIDELIQQGAIMKFLKKIPGKLTLQKRIKNKIFSGRWHKKFYTNLSAEVEKKEVNILVSQAGGFDFSYTYLNYLAQWLQNGKNRYHVIVQNVPDVGFTLSIDAALKQKKIFDGAYSVGFVSHRNRLSAERILAAAIPNAISITNPLNFKDLPEYIEFPGSSDSIEFAEVAALRCFHKGQDILLQAFSGKEWKNRNWLLNFYGHGPDEVYLQKLAIFYGIENRVFFHGHVKNIIDVWKKNHLHILPSLGEGTPLALIESMVCGRPVITTDVGGNAEYTVHLENGFIADYPTLPALKKVLELAWQDKNRWKEMGQKAREKILNNYDLNSDLFLYNKMQKTL